MFDKIRTLFADTPEAKVRGQWLLGLNYSNEHLDSVRTTTVDTTTITDTVGYSLNKVGLATRLYVGANRAKGFVEGNMKYDFRKQIKAGFNLGAECNIVDGLWIMLNYYMDFSRDLSVSGSKWQQGWGFKADIRFNLPEKFKLF